MFREAARLDPRGRDFDALANALLRSRRFVEAREAYDRALSLSPSTLATIQSRAMTFLGEGDLSGARASLQASAAHVDSHALVSQMANYNDLGWVLDEPQRELLLRLTPTRSTTTAARGASASRRPTP